MKRIHLLIMSLIAAAAVGCDRRKPAEPPAPPTVVTATAVEGSSSGGIKVIGQVLADKDVALMARVDGFLMKRNFKEGDVVKKGDVLYEIEPDQYAADVAADEAALERSKAAAENAAVEEARELDLYQKRASSQRDYDKARTRALECKADVQVCEANLRQAKLNLSYTKITAPFDGRVGLSTVEVGDMVGAASGALTTVTSISPIRVRFNLSELLLTGLTDERIHPEASKLVVHLFFENGKEYPLTGKIAYWDNQISTTTGTIQIHAVFANPDNILISGQNVRISIEGPNSPNVILIPRLALQEDQQGKYVFVVADNKIQRRAVESGGDSGDSAIILKGLQAGETVVVEGFQKIRNGITVTQITEAEREAQRKKAADAITGTAAPAEKTSEPQPSATAAVPEK
ncbi:MAG: efflux RND transporter periplasmic adaptor subunit [Victivallaceae bacterium]|nr:efflux RND transporter periplasmic adaptor subunit [Victivallaceae bacterium]